MLSEGQFALLRVARSQLGLSKTKFRELVRIHGGVRSPAELDDHGFRSLLSRLKRDGFRHRRKTSRGSAPTPRPASDA